MLTKKNYAVILACVICIIAICAIVKWGQNSKNEGEESLQLVVVLFRHGERTNDLTYPKDPYINDTYYPYGNGELTNEGKQMSYKLGETLRKLYNTFLGPIYYPNLITPVSSDFSRTKCTLQLVLAGLFPPTDTELEWDKDLDWNPIPFSYISAQDDRIIVPPIVRCPKYRLLFAAYRQSSEGLAVEETFKPLYSYICNKTGLIVTSLFDVAKICYILKCEKEWGYTLPNWTNLIYPDYCTEACKIMYKPFIGTSQLKQLFGGFLLKKIINDIYQKIRDTSSQPKMIMYSGHDMTVNGLLGTLNLFYPHVPAYGACILIELYKTNSEHYVKVRYNKEGTDTFFDMVIPGCTRMCPLKDFHDLVKIHIPGDGDPCAIK